MIPIMGEAKYARWPLLPEDWRKYAPHLCEGVGADYLLIDLGPVEDHPRYTVIALGAGAYIVHFLETIEQVLATREQGGLGVVSSLFVPLHKEHQRHHGHIAALYRESRTFGPADVAELQGTAARFLAFLSGR